MLTSPGTCPLPSRLIDRFFSAFDEILTSTKGDVNELGKSIPFPLFSERDISCLCALATDHFRSQPIVLRIESEVVIAGDIHGSFHDLVRILWHHKMTARYLFLGDYVDRGPFSLECILLLFTLACKFPRQFALIRGNHELRRIADLYGFRQELSAEYPESVFDDICTTFSWMPLVAIVQDRFFCVHGGIGPSIRTIATIEAIARPILVDTADNVKPLLWADPCDTVSSFAGSLRGDTTVYGPEAVLRFLHANHLEGIIRGHECVDSVKRQHGMPVITVFSASNYAVGTPNTSGVLVVPVGEPPVAKSYPPIERVRRDQAMFFMAGKNRSASPPHQPSIKALIPKLESFGGLRSASLTLGRPIRNKAVVPTSGGKRRSATFFDFGSIAAGISPVIERSVIAENDGEESRIGVSGSGVDGILS
jgi:diadenosine tetraphosphatase ApaH/serine/threonine PP2A family protein phosphatase